MAYSNLVVGTAGHIDHGKTSLVRALTGVDLDRLPEERERGITIALGFTPLNLPSGRQIAFVDVPGHERLVRTMISGATGIDAVMLCVSAVEGVMPQTREHLAILDLLDIDNGVIALTMCDLVDEEMIELASLDVAEATEGTFLEGAPVVATSAQAGVGLETLLGHLDALPDGGRSPDGPFRLPVDRAFIKRGFGTVVTGTIRSGRITDGSDVEILPAEIKARVRGIEVHGEATDEAVAGQRSAINLAGVERDDLHRGQTIVRSGALPTAQILDATYRHLADAPTIEHGARVRVLLGTAEVMAVVSVLDTPVMEPGTSHYIQLRTESPLVALVGDRFILRRESPVTTLGGGKLLDPWAPRARKRDHERALAECRALDAGEEGPFLDRAGDFGLSAADAALRGVTGGVVIAERHYEPKRVERWEEALVTALDAWHTDNPLRVGAPKRDLHRGVLGHLPSKVFDAVVDRLASRDALHIEGPNLRTPGFEITLDPAQKKALAALSGELEAAGLTGPKMGELSGRADLLHLLLGSGEAVRVGDRVLHRGTLEGLIRQVDEHLASHETMPPTAFKELTGLSRKHAIPLLEWLDSEQITMREGDDRRRHPSRG